MTTNLCTVDSKRLLVINVDFFERTSHSYVFGLDEPESPDSDSDSALTLKYLENQLTIPVSDLLFAGKYYDFNLKLSQKNTPKINPKANPTTAPNPMSSEY